MKRFLAILLACLLAMSVAVAEGDDKTVIKMLMPHTSVDLNEDYVAKLMEEATGFKVEYYQLPAENADQALALEMASGTDYDLVRLSKDQYNLLKSQGALRALNDQLDAYPIVKEKVYDLGWSFVTEEDGRILGIPAVSDGTYTGGLAYRVDMFEEYGWELPETVEDFYALLKEIKETTGLIPLTGKTKIVDVIASGFGLDYNFVIGEDGTVTSFLRQEGMKDYLAFMNQLYKEELIDVDWPVNTTSSIANKVTSEQVVIAVGGLGCSNNWTPALTESTGHDVIFENILPLTDKNGVKHISVTASIDHVTVMPANVTDERADYLMSMVAARLEDETYWLMNDGIEGVHYTKDEAGLPTPIQPQFGDDMSNGNYFQIGNNKDVHAICWLARCRKNAIQYANFEDAQIKAAPYGLLVNDLSFATGDAYTKYNASLKTMYEDFFMAVMAGTKSVDDLDAFITEWEEAGGLEVEECLTEWYKANTKIVEATRVLPAENLYTKIYGQFVAK